ncbi:HlyC/CorC family transporter [Chryseobacterium indologenes]|uniref:HlyC/CorC family transporter n=1 Tax=Chryseobacterium indologenes TaxID=253 RepID=A0A5R9PTA0_CHRID|nr:MULTISPECIES: hemolysin family protein [Chryseobacterium]ASE61376.1 HlyC/CorC family transporter [Chryseobacterium indologenes]ATN05457.1 HlyC/CorC family transporter [Chryseobacterium indologenes]AYY85783.1 HlyC/CorC family transporter [Chryseobacterium indologenes]AYZ35552.1 HlyC/CorC family transporter [Chryseobacterium indologenes]AZB17048.1 HlyC/CorC family transporter [Chryseobacterium indologenes]
MDSDIVRLLLALFLVLLNGFFVAAEFSIVKVRYSQIQLKAAEGDSMAKQAEHIIKHLDEYLSATQLGITLASLALGWVGESALHHIVENIFHSLNFEMSQATITSVSLIISFVLITIMHIVFGELIPKSIAIRKSEATTMATAVPLRIFYTIFKPFIWLMNSMSNGFLRLIKIHPASEQEIHSTEELQLLVKQSADSGEIEEENYEIIKNAFDFTDHSAKQIMVPRQNITSIDFEEDVNDIINKIMDSGYSRIPVYLDSIDNVIGIFYTKEIIREFVKRKGDLDHEDLKDLMRDAFFVVESKKVSDLLKTFQLKKQHIAIVIDEFGGTEGIITLEDILEELVGEIQDEEDDEEKIVDKIAENTYWVQATQPLDEINEFLPKKLPLSEESEYNSLAGFILYELEEIPEENQEFDLDNYHFKILKMNNKSVELVELVYQEPNAIDSLADKIGEV